MVKAKKNTQESSLRIIAGQWKGRRIRFQGEGIRPTGDRIRETLFNWLEPWIRDARCLDLFAGTGALGFEALSRGAAATVFVEKNRQVARQLGLNIQTLQTEAARVLATAGDKLDYRRYGPFDIVFLDPPFDQLNLSNLCRLIESADCLSPVAHIYIEVARQSEWPALPESWEVIRDRTAGQVRYALVKRTAENEL